MDLRAVRPVFEHEGPFVTVHSEVGRGTEDAAQQLDARWTKTRHDLEHHDVDRSLVEEIGERLRENARVDGEARRTVVAAGGAVVLDAVQAGHSRWPETVEVAPLPDLAGWLTVADGELPFVLVVTDREGADLEVHRALSRGVAARQQVKGSSFHITKVPEGDWAQKQFQQTAQNTWHENAHRVADEVRSLVNRYGARLVVVAGDVRARSDVAAQLDKLDATLVQTDAGGRGEGASREALWAQVEVALAEEAAEEERRVIGALEQARGQGRGAALGLDEVLDAFAKAQVERLVLDLGRMRDRTVDPSRHEGLAAPAGALARRDLPADRVLVAVAARTDAAVTLLPAYLGRGGGVAGLLRWSETG